MDVLGLLKCKPRRPSSLDVMFKEEQGKEAKSLFGCEAERSASQGRVSLWMGG